MPLEDKLFCECFELSRKGVVTEEPAPISKAVDFESGSGCFVCLLQFY